MQDNSKVSTTVANTKTMPIKKQLSANLTLIFIKKEVILSSTLPKNLFGKLFVINKSRKIKEETWIRKSKTKPLTKR